MDAVTSREAVLRDAGAVVRSVAVAPGRYRDQAEVAEKGLSTAIGLLESISTHVHAGSSLDEFCTSLSASIAGPLGARRVLFWRLKNDRSLTPIPSGHGIDEEFLARLSPLRCERDGEDITSQVVYRDVTLRAMRGDHEEHAATILDALGVNSAISASWRAGQERLGLVAAYDSRRADGFSSRDAWLLQAAGLGAGLFWQLKQTESSLTEALARLEKVDAARRLLLRNASRAVDSARKRFATELHDDALQKLTAAELQLQRVGGGGSDLSPLGDARALLAQAEDALRRLVFELRPPSLEKPGGFEQTIRERVGMLRSLTGIEADVMLDLPDGVAIEVKSIIFRQVAEALTNVEKHAAAKTVRVVVTGRDGGIHGAVIDDGRGFIVAERDHLPGHLGLLALNERALLAGGWCRIESKPGLGTSIEFWIPVAS